MASFEPTFSKKLKLLRGAHPLSDTPLRRASATAGADAPFFTSKILAPHFENRSVAYAWGGEEGQSATPDSKKFAKNWEKDGKNQENRGKIGKKWQKLGRFFHFVPPDR